MEKSIQEIERIYSVLNNKLSEYKQFLELSKTTDKKKDKEYAKNRMISISTYIISQIKSELIYPIIK